MENLTDQIQVSKVSVGVLQFLNAQRARSEFSTLERSDLKGIEVNFRIGQDASRYRLDRRPAARQPWRRIAANSRKRM